MRVLRGGEGKHVQLTCEGGWVDYLGVFLFFLLFLSYKRKSAKDFGWGLSQSGPML